MLSNPRSRPRLKYKVVAPEFVANAEEFSRRLTQVTRSGDGYRACCPAHDDRNPSLDFKDGDTKLVVTCRSRGCAFEDIVRAWRDLPERQDRGPASHSLTENGARRSKTVATYPYVDESGQLLYEVVRLDPKSFRQRRPDGRGGHVANLNGVRRVPYRLPELKGQKKVYVTEGEKDADALRDLDLTATTNAGGAGRWSDDFTTQLVRAGAEEVVILPDRDAPGERHAADVARSCLKASLRVKVVTVPDPYKDVSDAIAGGWTKAGLIRAEMAASPLTLGDLPESGPRATSINLADVAVEEVEWLWTGRIPRGMVTLLIGDPGVGKSKVTVDIASRHTRGAAWPDGSIAPIGRAILLTAEDNLAQTVKPRVVALGGDPAKIDVLEAVRDGDDGGDQERHFSLDTDLVALDRLIEETGAGLVVIDPLSAYLGEHDSHADADIRRVLGPLAKLAERRRAAVVCVMHLTKDQQRRALYRAQGSIAFVAAARSVLAVVKDTADDARLLFVSVKSNLGPKPPALAFMHDVLGLEWERDPVADVDVELLFQTASPDDAPARREAEELLRTMLSPNHQKADDVKAAAKANGISDSTLFRAKRALKVRSYRRGSFAEPGPWWWALPTTKSEPKPVPVKVVDGKARVTTYAPPAAGAAVEP